MWIITTFGFFSVVEKPEQKGTGMVTIRARVRRDLEELRDRYLPSMGPISDKKSDYPHRAVAQKEAVGEAMRLATIDIDYGNFKDTVIDRQGLEREKLYADVWEVLQGMEHDEPAMVKAGKSKPATKPEVLVPPSKADSAAYQAGRKYGGVLVDPRGQLLLVEPANHNDNTWWTWPKGGPEKGDKTMADVVIREVLEETGYVAEIIAPIPGEWRGSAGTAQYFLMRPIQKKQGPHWEIQSTKWVLPEEAPGLIAQTTKEKARKRDLEVLAAALLVIKARSNTREVRPE